MNGSRPSAPAATDSAAARKRFRLLSCNIQAGIRTSNFRDYATGAWKHLVHHDERLRMLARMADTMRGYDLVGLQESDAGSLRTGFVGQTEYLARRAGYAWWGERTNRRVGKLARHSIGAMCRFEPVEVEPLKLPGRVPGRGALMLRLFSEGDAGLAVIIVHLALGRASRRQQIDFIAERIQDLRHAVILGDFNAAHAAPEMRSLFRRTGLVEPVDRVNTWPSWNPLHNLDHILVTSDLEAEPMQVLAEGPSDHLPVALEIRLPPECRVDERELAATGE